MPCPRCGGFVVVDRSYAHLHGATTDRPMRCVNCGNYEDAVIDANRRHSPALRHCARAVDLPGGGVLTVW
jgi:hypothetical protein